jgi:folate-binding protein YgfZ
MATQATAHENLTLYQTAKQHGGWRFVPDGGGLLVQGEDRISFFQRQTTNDLRTLNDQIYIVTVLTSPTARILDVLTITQQGEDLLVFTLPERGATTKKYLQSRIFFMDKVTVEDTDQKLIQIELFGPALTNFLGTFGINGAQQNPFKRTLTTIGEGITILGPQIAGMLGCRLVFPEPASSSVQNTLVKHGFAPVTPEIYDILRIESGIPGALSELTQDYTPLETGMEDTISSSKGCYTGQEVIARQITYDKVTRGIAGMTIQSEPSEPVTAGVQVYAENQPVGTLTSCGFSPEFGWIGLAVLKHPFDSPSQHVQIKAAEPINAKVVDLPFMD